MKPGLVGKGIITRIFKKKFTPYRHWINYFSSSNEPGSPSYKIYLGRNIPRDSTLDFEYVDEDRLKTFIEEQPYFDSYTLWRAEGEWHGDPEETIVFEVFDTDFDIIEMFAQLYIDTFEQEAAYIKISYDPTIQINGDNYASN